MFIPSCCFVGFTGDATFDLSGKSTRRRAQRARKRQGKLLILCLAMLVCFFFLTFTIVILVLHFNMFSLILFSNSNKFNPTDIFRRNCVTCKLGFKESRN